MKSEKIDILSGEEIVKIKQILDVISLKAESEHIENSADLLMNHIPSFTYAIEIPYNHFPTTLKPSDINKITASLADNFGVINSVKFSPENISLRFPLYNNEGFKNFKKIIDAKVLEITELNSKANTLKNSSKESSNTKYLKSIHLITPSIAVKDVIFLVLDEQFEKPTRFNVRNKNGDEAYIKKLHNIAYLANVPNMKVDYSKQLADNLNNGLFRRREISRYIKTNNFKKPTLVKKSENGKLLVLKNEIPIIAMLVYKVPSQYQPLYLDKTL